MTDEFKAEMLKAMAPLEGWCTPEKACEMADIILEHKPALAVETGIFGGKSAIPIAMALREAGAGVLYGIDPWTKDAALDGRQEAAHIEWWSKVDLEAIYNGFVRAAMELQLGYHLRWLRMTSERVAACFGFNSIDFFHQDSNHSEQVSCREVWMWGPKMKQQSFWVFDDSDWPSTQKAMGIIRKLGFKPVSTQEKYTVFRR